MNAEISVVIPVYNARDCLSELIARIQPVLNFITMDWEIVFVEDCSTDGSMQELERLTAGNQRILLIKNPTNIGQHQSLITGIGHSHGKYTVIMDCDLQDAPELIAGLYQQILRKSCDAVIVQWINYSNGPFRFLFSRLNAFKRYLQGKKNNDPNLAIFRIFNQKMKTHLMDKYQPGMLFRDIFDPMQFRLTYQRNVRQKRYSGSSSYSLFKLAKTSLKN